MAYTDAIKNLKDALKSYSAQEEKLSQLYKEALSTLEKQQEQSKKHLEASYASDRNTAYSDTLREERNLFNSLAQRGLGSSGEATQTKLNSNILLSNRLGELERNKNASQAELELQLETDKTALLKEKLQQQNEIAGERNRLNTDIAQLELKQHQTSSGSSGSTGGYGNGNGKNESTAEKVEGYVPDIDPVALAKQIVNSATYDGKYIRTDIDKLRIDKYLIELKDDYNINADYLHNLIFSLEGYGYQAGDESDKRVSVIIADAAEYYNDEYERAYDEAMLQVGNTTVAKSMAERAAINRQLQYAYNKSRTLAEFKRCAAGLNINKLAVDEFLSAEDRIKKSDEMLKMYSNEKVSAGKKPNGTQSGSYLSRY